MLFRSFPLLRLLRRLRPRSRDCGHHEARCLFAPFELPVGILLSLIGGPFFLGLLLHGRGRRMYD